MNEPAVPELPVLSSLDEMATVIRQGGEFYVRWSQGPYTDLPAPESEDDLTGVPLPGLSANPLHVEPWWEDRPVRLWVARRLHDYSHLQRDKGPGVRPWILQGRLAGRGPDNEPLVADVRPLAWVAAKVIAEAEAEVGRRSDEWGTLRRAPSA